MFRILNFVSVIALLAAAGAVYHVKYSSAFDAQKIAKLRDEIRWERDRIATLNAEWARRTTPDRIQTLAEHHLEMQPLDTTRMDTLASLPAKPEQTTDALAGMLEALADGPSGAAAIPTGAKPASGTSGSAPSRPAAPKPQPVARTAAPLPLTAIPAAGVVATPGARSALTAPPAGTTGAHVSSPIPLLPPAAVGQ